MNATQLPDLAFFQWSTPSNPKPTLAQPIGKTDTTLRFSAPPLDSNGDVIAKDFIMGIRHPNGYIESVYVPASDLSTDGLVAENCVRGIDLEGLDYNTGDASLTYSFDQDTPVFCNITGVMQSIMSGVILGSLSTGGTVFKVGKGADDDIYYYAQNADANKPYIRYNKTLNKWYISNDGVNDIDIASGGVSTASKGITIVAGDIQLDLTDTTAFKDARTGNEKIAVVTKEDTGLIDTSFYDIASQAEAEAGIENTKIMTALRVSQSNVYNNKDIVRALAGENLSLNSPIRFGYATTGGTQTPSVGAQTSARYIGYDTNTTKSAFKVVNTYTGYITSISIDLRKQGTPTGNITAKIYSDAGVTLLGTSTNTIAESTLLSSFSTQTFNFTNISATGSDIYVSLEVDRSNSTTNYSESYIGTLGLVNGSYIINSSGVWSSSTAAYAKYSITVAANGEDNNKLYISKYINFPSYQTRFIGFSNDVYNTGDTAVATCSGLKDGFTGLTNYKKYYLDASGGITGTTGTPVGRAIGTTNIRIMDDILASD